MILIQTSRTLTPGRRTLGCRAQRGFALGELAIALVVVSLVFAAAIAALVIMTRQNSVSSNTEAIHQVATSLKKTFGMTNTFGTVTTALAVTSEAIPGDLRNSGTTTASNKFGGLITVAPTTITSPNDALLLTWANVPKAQCFDIALGSADIATRIEVPAGTIVKPVGGDVDAGALSTACENAAASDIVFAVGRN